MKELALEGIDGSGKSSTAIRIKEKLEERDLKVSLAAPYRLANAMAGKEIYPMWSDPDQAIEAVSIVASAVASCREKAIRNNCDVLLFDRHWMTGLSMIEPDSSAYQAWLDEESLIPVTTAVLRVGADTALSRKSADSHETWMNRRELSRDTARLSGLAWANPEYILREYDTERLTIDQTATSIIRAACL